MRRSLLIPAIGALAIGCAFPYIEIAWKCRAGFETSEACVWGRAYLPLSRWIEPIIIAPLVFALLSAGSWLLSRARGRA